MAKKQSTSPATLFFLLLALVASATVLLALLLNSAGPDSVETQPATSSNGLDYEFYNVLRNGDSPVNSSGRNTPLEVADSQAPAEQPAAAGPNDPTDSEIERLAAQLTVAREPADAASEALEQIAESIAVGLETVALEPAGAPEPIPPAPAETRRQADIVLAAPEPAPARAQSGTLLQSGAFRQRELALSELERQRSLGLDVEIRPRQGQNGALYLLQSGPYDTGDKLEEAEMVFRLHNIDTARRSSL